MPRGVKGSGKAASTAVEIEVLDFENCPRYELGARIDELTAQVEKATVLAEAGTNTPQLQRLAEKTHKLLEVLGAGGVKKRRKYKKRDKEAAA